MKHEDVKPGMMVTVVSRNSHIFIKEMEKYIGKTYMVKDVNDEGEYIRLDTRDGFDLFFEAMDLEPYIELKPASDEDFMSILFAR